MRTRLSPLFFLLLLAPTGCRDDRILSADEVTRLFAGKTVEGYHEKKGYRFKSFYEPSGKFRSYQGSDRKLRRGSWRVDSKGSICVKWEDQRGWLCRKIVTDDKGHYWKIKIKRVKRRRLKRILIVSFIEFIEGNPENL